MTKNIDQQNLFVQRVKNITDGNFSGDKKNLNIKKFVETCSHPLCEDEEIITNDLSWKVDGNRHSALYNFLGYSSKKPYEAIEKYVAHFSKTNDLLFDPFCGSGGLGIVSIKNNRHCLLFDSSPLATLISKGYCTYVDTFDLKKAFENISKSLISIENKLYGTKCHIDNTDVIIDASIWSQTYRCVKCFEVIAIQSTNQDNQCPHCKEKVSTRQQRLGYVPWGVRYYCNNQKMDIIRSIDGPDDSSIKAFKQFDFDQLANQCWNAFDIGFVDRPMMNYDKEGPWGLLWRPYHGSIRNVSQFFTKRNLYAIQYILKQIVELDTSNDVKDLLKLALANITPSASIQQRHYPGSTFPNMVMPGVLFTPPVFEEINVIQRFLSKKRSLLRGQEAVNSSIRSGKVLISTQDSSDLTDIPSNAIDYIFTDPPYSGRIQYGELNFIQESILGLNTSWLNNEVIVNEARGFTADTWQDRLYKIMKESFRVLKPGRWISVCFHDSDPSSWERLQDVMLMAGFIPGSGKEVASIETGWQTLKMHTSEDITKRDLVINYRKPLPSEITSAISITGEEDNETFGDKVRAIVRDYLDINPGAAKDRIYDEVVSHMVRAGKMEAHNFDELLLQVAEPTEGSNGLRWYLKDSSLDIIDAAESAKEDAAAEKISTFITGYLAKHPTAEGVHYSDIFEQFVYTVKDKPRRPLAEWLLDYFFKTDDGTYRLPLSEEEKRLKSEGRSKGTQRRIKRYIAFLQQGVAIPDKERPNDSTLAEWVRHCKRSGLYEQGKLLYEKGGLNLDNLPEEAMVNVEEDYQVCVRLLARGGGAAADAKPKRGRKAKA